MLSHQLLVQRKFPARLQHLQHLLHLLVQQQGQCQARAQADHAQATIHLLPHRVHRVLETIHLHREVLGLVQAVA